MDARQRMLAIKLSDKIRRNPTLARELGVTVNFKTNDKKGVSK